MYDIVFSVSLITFNQEQYIAQTIESIISQEHNYAYELIIGDDCSSDNTCQIIKQYADKYPNIIKPIFNETNVGILKNYYNVINNCKGKYIMECAGDDFWLPNKVNTQIDFMENHKDYGMCYSRAKSWLERKHSFDTELVGQERNSIDDMLKGNTIPALSVCLRKSLVDTYIKEINPLEKNWLMEDYPMWLWFFKNTKVKFFDNALCVYRLLEESASHSTIINKELNFNESVHDIKRFFVNKYNISFDLNNDYYYSLFIIYLNRLKIKYDASFARELRKQYKSMSIKQLKLSIYCFFSYNSILWSILMMILVYSKNNHH